MKNLLACLAATIALGLAPASAQRILTDPEMAMCVGYMDFKDRLYGEWKSVDNQLKNYSLNKRSASSVNRYNKLVSVANRLLTIVNSWNSYLNNKCINVTVSSYVFQRVCRARHFDLSYEDTRFCKSWQFSSIIDTEEKIDPASMTVGTLTVAPHAMETWEPVEIIRK